MEKITRVGNEVRVAANEYASKYIAVYAGEIWGYVWMSDVARAAGWRGKLVSMKYGADAIAVALEGGEVEFEEVQEGLFWASDVVVNMDILKEMIAE